MHIRTLEHTTLPQLTEAFNHAFSDYLIPLHLTEAAMQAKIKSEHIQLHLSVGVFDGDLLVAFILHGYDVLEQGPVVYNGGTGVRPGYRGQKLTGQMYDFSILMLKERGIFQHQLEVIEGNIKAIKAYERVGFKTVRKLDCYKGTVTYPNAQHLQPEIISPEQLTALQHWATIQPTWQNSTPAILRHPQQHQLWGVKKEGRYIAYAACTPANARIKQIAVATGYRRQGIGSSLLAWLQQQNPAANLMFTNVDATHESAKAFLLKSGLQPFLHLMEMKLQVAD